jgi:hypothetical protein
MKKFVLVALAISVCAMGNAVAKGPKTEVFVGSDASQWFSDFPNPATGYFPIGGAGQLNGEFVIVVGEGVEIGLRATDRKDGLLTATGKKKGVYLAATGLDQNEAGRAEWNYDWHVDLRGSGTTLSDYDLTLIQTFAPKLLGEGGPLDLTFPDLTFGILDNAVLYQSSQNPSFFNDTFDPFAEGTYNLVLKLKPKKGGPGLAAHIKVIVTDE